MAKFPTIEELAKMIAEKALNDFKYEGKAVREWIEPISRGELVEVVHGEWNIGKFNAGRETVIVECSECAAVFEVPTFIFGLNYNYCPNCGADMRGSAEDG